MAGRKTDGSPRAARSRGCSTAILLIAVAFAPFATATADEAAKVPRPPGRLARQILMLPEPIEIPDYAFAERMASGEVVERAIVEFEGRIVLLNFWATWCGVCRKEMPKLDVLAGRLGGEGLPMEVLALSIDDEIDEAGRALEKRGHQHLRVFHDHQAVLAPLLGVRGVPTTFVVDPTGRAVAVTQGPADWDSDEALGWLKALSAAPPPPVPVAPPVLQSAAVEVQAAAP